MAQAVFYVDDHRWGQSPKPSVSEPASLTKPCLARGMFLARTLEDCAAKHLPPELLRGAALDALGRGLVARRELAAIEAALAPFGGLAR